MSLLLLGACGSDSSGSEDSTTGADPAAPSTPDTPVVSEGSDNADVQQNLDDARTLWASNDFSIYEYTITYQCFCPTEELGPFTALVTEGEVTNLTEGSTKELATVQALFDMIQEAIDEGAATIEVSYDETTGHPTSVWIDIDEMMADEEHGVTVTDLVAIQS